MFTRTLSMYARFQFTSSHPVSLRSVLLLVPCSFQGLSSTHIIFVVFKSLNPGTNEMYRSKDKQSSLSSYLVLCYSRNYDFVELKFRKSAENSDVVSDRKNVQYISPSYTSLSFTPVTSTFSSFLYGISTNLQTNLKIDFDHLHSNPVLTCRYMPTFRAKNPEDEDRYFLQNVGMNRQLNTGLQCRRPTSTASPAVRT